jgi:hypothetical protein
MSRSTENTEAYIDDIVIKLSKPGDFIQDFLETFNNL